MKILKKIKRMLKTGKILNSQKIIDKIKNYQVISFDLFDTLLKRNVKYPYQVFALMELEVGKEFPNFCEKRRKAELTARKTCQYEDVSLEDIYNCYEDITTKDKSYLIKKELEYELSLIMVNDSMYEVYQYAKKAKKRILIITDIYYSREFIIKLLNKCKIDEYDGLYISSEIRKTKKIGSLFQYALKKEKLKEKDVIHIGDSYKNDYKSARKKHIKAIYIPNYEKKNVYQVQNKNDKVEIDVLNSFLNNTYKKEINSYYKFGYEKFGMFVYGYIKWLYEELEKKNINKVYFFSRDGLLMKQAFDIYNKNNKIESFYIEVSRRSLRVPILWIDFSLNNLIKVAKITSVKSFFSVIGLDINNYTKELKECNLSEKELFDYKKIENNSKFIKLFNLVKEDIVQNSKKEYENLKIYLDKQNVKGKIAVVDIGWGGTMQRQLEMVLDKMNVPCEVYGYYIGVDHNYINNIKLNPNLKMKGYLYDFLNNKNETEDRHQCFVGLFESLFLEQNGSVKNYEINDKKEIVAVRYPYEYEINGEKTYEYKCIKEIQRGTLDFIESFSKEETIKNLEFYVEDLYNGLRLTGEAPSFYEIKLFGDFNFYDDVIGVLAKPKSVLYYVIHPRKLKEDFLGSRWKTAFLKRLLKLPLPYKKIYLFLRRFK